MIKHSLFISLTFILVTILSGCISPHPPNFYFDVDPINHSFKADTPLRIGIVLTDEFKNATWVWEEHKATYHIGGAFSEKVKEISAAVFSDVMVVDNNQALAISDVTALLTPKLISFERTRPVLMTSDQISTGIIKWTLTDIYGAIIWVDTITVEGKSPGAIGLFTLKTFSPAKRGTEKQLELLMKDFFNQSVSAMKSSVEIQEFVKNSSLKKE